MGVCLVEAAQRALLWLSDPRPWRQLTPILTASTSSVPSIVRSGPDPAGRLDGQPPDLQPVLTFWVWCKLQLFELRKVPSGRSGVVLTKSRAKPRNFFCLCLASRAHQSTPVVHVASVGRPLSRNVHGAGATLEKQRDVRHERTTRVPHLGQVCGFGGAPDGGCSLLERSPAGRCLIFVGVWRETCS